MPTTCRYTRAAQTSRPWPALSPTLSSNDILEERELMVSPDKSTVTLFTPATAEAKIHPEVKVQGQPVKLDKTPKLLGVTYDTTRSAITSKTPWLNASKS